MDWHHEQGHQANANQCALRVLEASKSYYCFQHHLIGILPSVTD